MITGFSARQLWLASQYNGRVANHCSYRAVLVIALIHTAFGGIIDSRREYEFLPILFLLEARDPCYQAPAACPGMERTTTSCLFWIKSNSYSALWGFSTLLEHVDINVGHRWKNHLRVSASRGHVARLSNSVDDKLCMSGTHHCLLLSRRTRQADGRNCYRNVDKGQTHRRTRAPTFYPSMVSRKRDFCTHIDMDGRLFPSTWTRIIFALGHSVNSQKWLLLSSSIPWWRTAAFRSPCRSQSLIQNTNASSKHFRRYYILPSAH